MRAAAIPTIITTSTTMADGNDIYWLAAWLSPSFPVGAYTYSSGLEFAVEDGIVRDAAALEAWLAGIFRHGSASIDGGFFCAAHRASATEDWDALGETLDRADALRPTAELALESASQGEAFLKTMRAAWPHDGLDRLAALAKTRERKPAYAVAVGAACGFHGLDRDMSLTAFLHALAANLVSAAVRAVPLGQTDGQRVTAALQPVVAELAETIPHRSIDELGAATPMVDWASMRHETQHTRLFRS